MHLLKQICSHEAFCAQRVHPFHAQLPHLPVPVQVRPGCPLQFPLGSAGFRRMSVVCATAPGVCRALVLTGRWLSGTSTWPRKSSLVCHTESKFTSERQKTININLVTMRQKRKMGEYHYFRNRWFLPRYCCHYLLTQFIDLSTVFPVTLQTGSWSQGSCGGADDSAWGEPPKPTQSPPGGFLLMGDRSKAPLLVWQPHTYPWWEQLTQQGEFQPLGPARGCYPQRHGNVGSRTPKDTSGRGVSAVGPGPCAPGTFGIHSDRNFQDQTQPLTRECIFSQILFVTPDISPSDSQITCCLFITMLCMEFQEVQAAAAQPSLHISHSRALSLILKFIFYMITS